MESCCGGVCSQSSRSTLSPDVCVSATQREKLSNRVNNTQLPIASSSVGEILRVFWLSSLTSVLKELLAVRTHFLRKSSASSVNCCLVHVCRTFFTDGFMGGKHAALPVLSFQKPHALWDTLTEMIKLSHC